MTQPLTQRAITACNAAEDWHRHCLERIGKLDQDFRRQNASPRLMAPWAHFTRGLREHFAIEESRVFPAIRAMARGQVPEREDYASPLHDLRFELDEIRTIADALANAAPDAGPREADLLALLDELEEHARREEKELFPMAMELLASAAQHAPGEGIAPAPTRAPADPGLEGLLGHRRGGPVKLVHPGEAPPAGAAGPRILLLTVAELPRAPIDGATEVLLQVEDPEDPALPEAIGRIGAQGLPVSLLLRCRSDEDGTRAGQAWRLALAQPRVRELFVLAPDPKAQAHAFGIGPASVTPHAIETFNEVIATLRQAFHTPAGEALHWAAVRLPSGDLGADALFDLEGLAADARRLREGTHLHRTALLAALVRHAAGAEAARLLGGLIRQQARLGRGARDALLVVTFAR